MNDKNFIESIKEKAKWRFDEHVSTMMEGETSVTRLRIHRYVKFNDVKEALMDLVAELKKLTPNYGKVLWAIKSDKEKKQIFQYAFEMVKTQVLVSLDAKETKKC